MLYMITLIAFATAVAVGPLSVRYGADSRPGFDERPEPRAPTHRSI